MYEYHGWAVVLESTSDDVSHEVEEVLFETLKKYIEDLKPFVDVLDRY